MRVPAAGHEVDDGDAVGCDRRLRQQADRAGEFLGLRVRDVAPSSRISPPVGLISRASDRSSVDLPQALGPMMTVNEPSGIATSRSSMIVRPSYPVTRARACSRAVSGSLRHQCAFLPKPASSHTRYAPPRQSGDDADRQLGRCETRPRDQVADHAAAARRTTAAGMIRTPRRAGHAPHGDLRARRARRTRSARPMRCTTRRQHDAEQQHPHPGWFGAHAQPAAGVVAHFQHAHVGATEQHQRQRSTSTRCSTGTVCTQPMSASDPAPQLAAVIACSQPHPGEQPGVERAEEQAQMPMPTTMIRRPGRRPC